LEGFGGRQGLNLDKELTYFCLPSILFLVPSPRKGDFHYQFMKNYQNSTLTNQLNLTTASDVSSEIVTLNLCVKAGARHESDDQLGYAHLLEHLLLKGSKRYPSVFSVAVVTDRAGAYLNASTGIEKITLTVQVAKSALEQIFKLLADLMQNPLFDPTVLENEKKVIKQEIGKIFDSHPERLWLETLPEIFPNHPLNHHPIGNEASVASATAEALIGYHHRFFVPQRAALIASGVVTHQQMIDLANKYLADWSRVEIIEPLVPPPINPINRPSLKFVVVDSRQTYLNLVFSGPSLDQKQRLVLDIISEYLGHGRTSLLNQELRQKNGLVYSLFVGAINYQDASLLRVFTATAEPEQVTKLLLDLTAQAPQNFSDTLLSEYKEQVKNGLRRSLSDPFAEVGFLASNWLLRGELVTPDENFALIDTITHADVVKMWQEYLDKKNLTLVALGEKTFTPGF